MKKLIALAAFLAASVCHADSTTNRLGLTLPTVGSPTWGQKVNGNFQIIDATVAALGSRNVFNSSATFNGYVQFNSTVNWRNLQLGAGQCLGINSSSNTIIVPCGGGGGGSPGGSNTNVQFNNGGLFGGSDNFNFYGSSTALVTNLGSGGYHSYYDGFALLGTTARVATFGNSAFGSRSPRFYLYVNDSTAFPSGTQYFGGIADKDGGNVMRFMKEGGAVSNGATLNTTNVRIDGFTNYAGTVTSISSVATDTGTFIYANANSGALTITLPDVDGPVFGANENVRGGRFIRVCKTDSSANKVSFAYTVNPIAPAGTKPLQYAGECQDFFGQYILSTISRPSYWQASGRMGAEGVVVSTISSVNRIEFADGSVQTTAGGGGGGGTPGLPVNSVQLNGGGVFVGTASLTMNTTSNLLTIGATTFFSNVTATTWTNVSSVTFGTGTSLVLSTSSNLSLLALPSQSCLGTDASGKVQAGSCGGGGGVSVYPATSTIIASKGINASTITTTGNVTIGGNASITGQLTVSDNSSFNKPVSIIQVAGSTSTAAITVTDQLGTILFSGVPGVGYGHGLQEQGYVGLFNGNRYSSNTFLVMGGNPIKIGAPYDNWFKLNISTQNGLSGKVFLSTYNCSGYLNGGKLTVGSDNMVTCADDISGGGGGSGSSVYNATSTVGMPYGFNASTGVFTSSVTAQGTIKAITKTDGVTQNSWKTFPTVATRNDANFYIGYKFIPLVDIQLTDVGRLYVAGNVNNHRIGIWNKATTAVVLDTVVYATATADATNFKYASITPITLTAGTEYVIQSQETAGGDTWIDNWDSTGYFSDYIKRTGFAYVGGTTFAFPTTQSSGNNIFNSCNFKFIPLSVPQVSAQYSTSTYMAMLSKSNGSGTLMVSGSDKSIAIGNPLSLGGATLAAGESLSVVGQASFESSYPIKTTNGSSGVLYFGSANNGGGIGGVAARGGYVLVDSLAADLLLNYDNPSSNVGISGIIGGAKLGVAGTSAANKVALFRGAAAQTGDLSDWQNNSGVSVAKVDNLGIGTFQYLNAGSGSFAINTNFNQILWSGAKLGWSPTASVNSGTNNADIALERTSAGILEVNNGTKGTYAPIIVSSISINGKVSVTATNTAGGTTGNQTINKPSGTVNFAAGATALTVTNSLVTTSSIVLAVVRTNDTTATIKNVVPGSGSFVINLGAAATAETSVGFVVIN